MNERPTVYALDFGTCNSLLAAANAERVFPPIPLDPSAPDPTVMRSVLFFPDASTCYYGADALARYVENGMQGRLIRSIKKHLPSRHLMGTYIEDRPMRLEDLVGAFLGAIRRRANEHFGADVRSVVLGRPARFSESPEDDRFAELRLDRAARIAGFTDVAFLPEPVAAARDFRHVLDRPRLSVIADLGAGTSDFTVLRLRPDGYDQDDVLGIGGLAVAGDALDGTIMRGYVAKHFGAEVTYQIPWGQNRLTMPKSLIETLCSPADLSILRRRDVRAFLEDVRGWSLGANDKQRMDHLFCLVDDALGFGVFEKIEQAKRALSDAEQATITYRYPGIEIDEPMERAGFERVAAPPIERILSTLDRTLESAGVAASDVEIVCCTGGTARVPRIADGLRARFERAEVALHNSFHSVIQGLAERARSIAANDAAA